MPTRKSPVRRRSVKRRSVKRSVKRRSPVKRRSVKRSPVKRRSVKRSVKRRSPVKRRSVKRSPVRRRRLSLSFTAKQILEQQRSILRKSIQKFEKEMQSASGHSVHEYEKKIRNLKRRLSDLRDTEDNPDNLVEMWKAEDQFGFREEYDLDPRKHRFTH